MKSIWYGVVSALFLATLVCGAAVAENLPQPKDLMSRALRLTDIRAQGSPPFQLTGSVTFFHTAKGDVKGTYTLIWLSPDQWRETTSFPGYTQVRLLDGNKMWYQHSSPRLPLRVFELGRALDYSYWLLGLKTTKAKARKRKGTRQWCFNLGSKGPGTALCFESASGVLLSYGDKAGRTELSDYQPWAGKVFPRTITVFIRKDRIAEFKAVRLSGLNHPSIGTFFPPPGSTESPGCQDPDPPKPLKLSQPDYPPSLRIARVAGIVRVLVKIGVDGKAHDVRVESSPDRHLGDLVRRAISDWRFHPASCQGTPVPFETEVDVSFKIQ